MQGEKQGPRVAPRQSCWPRWPCRCARRPPPPRPDRSSSASPGHPGRPGRPGDGRSWGPDGALPAQMEDVGADPGPFDWAPRDRFVGAPRLAAGSGRSRSCGDRRLGGQRRRRRAPRSTAQPTRTAWRNFLKAAVARYGPGGSYWANDYRQQYGDGRQAAADPVLADLERAQPEEVLHPRRHVDQSAQKYARLLQISHDAIKSRDPKAEIVLAGMPGYGDAEGLGVPRHPLRGARVKERLRRRRPAPLRAQPRRASPRDPAFRAVMTDHNDRATPLWLTELAWGSAPPTSSASTRASTVKSSCSSTPSS